MVENEVQGPASRQPETKEFAEAGGLKWPWKSRVSKQVGQRCCFIEMKPQIRVAWDFYVIAEVNGPCIC